MHREGNIGKIKPARYFRRVKANAFQRLIQYQLCMILSFPVGRLHTHCQAFSVTLTKVKIEFGGHFLPGNNMHMNTYPSGEQPGEYAFEFKLRIMIGCLPVAVL